MGKVSVQDQWGPDSGCWWHPFLTELWQLQEISPEGTGFGATLG